MCLRPITIKTEDAFGIPINQSVPCGKCIECLKDRQNSWKIRLIEEARDHKYVYFFTLTYRDDSIPFAFNSIGEKIYSVSKIDVQKWLKRNRIYYERLFNRSIDFKYFITSEYGPNTGRPHYHGILFTDITETFISRMFGDWREMYGFVNFSLVGSKGNRITSKCSVSSVSNYVAKYCLKVPMLLSPAEKIVKRYIEDDLIEKTFFLMSKGIGASYVKRMMRYHLPRDKDPFSRLKKICDRSFYRDGAFKYKMPRYYRDRFYRRKYPCDTQVWNSKLKVYETKVVYRYKSKNFLALQMQNEVRDRILAEYNRRYQEYSAICPYKSDTEISIELARSERVSKISRQKSLYSKMSRFYNTSRFKSTGF